MNQHLQNILNTIQQDKNLSEEEKNAIFKSLKDANKDFEIANFKLDRTEKVKRTTAILLEETIEELEQKRKAVEAQNRELEIESSLERVRTQAMSMNKPDDLMDICQVIYAELMLLGFNDLRNSMINIYPDDKTTFLNYDYSDNAGKTVTAIPYDFHPLVEKQISVTKNTKDAFYEMSFRGKELKDFRELRKTNGELDDTKLEETDSLHYYFYSIGKGSIGISTYHAIAPQKLELLKRFRNVFNLSYQRYTDIALAEAQAREAQIETGLERVRSRSMAMHHTSELQEVIHTVHKELLNLNIAINGGSFIAINSDIDTTLRCWGSGGTADTSEEVQLPLYEKPFCTNLINTIKNAPGLFTEQFTQQEKVAFFTFLFKHEPWSKLEADEKEKVLSSQGGYTRSCYISKHTSIFIINHFGKNFSEEENNILTRFGKVFEQTYTRFLDLQKAEAQARESQIETALERVRSRSMGMQKSEELKEVIKIIYEQLLHLKLRLDHAGFVVDYKPKGNWHFWIADSQEIPAKITHPYFDSVWAKQFDEAKEKGSVIFATHLNREEKNKFYKDLFSYIPGLPEQSKEFYFSKPGLDATTVLMEDVALYIENFDGFRYTDEENNTFIRFGKVFQQTYTRFLDLQKSEAQSRENKIQLALERARSQSMIMQHSNELDYTLRVFHEQVLLLNIPSAFSFLWLPDEKNDKHIFWAAWKEDENDSTVFKSKAINYPLDRNEPATNQCLIDWKGIEPIVSYHVPPAGVANYFAAWQELIDGVEQLKPEYFSAGLYYVEAFMKYGCFGVMVENDLIEDEKTILGRFAIEFERTYRRFLDLQKAEAQAREAEIELALERVRARTMAMQHSGELAEASFLLDNQVRALGIKTWGCAFNIYGDNESSEWFSSEGGTLPMYKTPRENIFLRYYEHGQKGEAIYVEEFAGEACVNHYNYLCTVPVMGDALKKAKENGAVFPKRQVDHVTYFKYGYLLFITLEPVPPSHDIFKRFAKVFEQTYTRFLDLQKAEAQAREAQIEMALEKVRSRTMAMQKSDELPGTAALLFEEFKKLESQELIQTTIGIYNEAKNEIQFSATNWEGGGKQVMRPSYGSMDEPTLLKPAVTAWKAKEKSIVVDLTGEALEGWVNYRNKMTDVIISSKDAGGRRVVSIAFFSKGHLSLSSPLPLPAETLKTLERFASVFDGTYTRFLDLLKAEAQAKESQIEVALERVRSRTLAMQKSDELAETAAVLFRQLILLGIQPNRLYIAIVKDDRGTAEFWITDEDGSKVSSAFETNLNDNPTFQKMFEGWKAEKKSLVIDMQGEELQDYFKYLTSIKVPFKGGLTQKRRLQDIAYFSKGFIGMASPEELPAETLQLLERFAAVFNLTYTRFNDLQVSEAHAIQAEQDLIAIKEAKQKAEIALTELQATQKQLIQSEKMASLGELTAGIAHEIQNPLNFVNNFSEVNAELIEEMVDEVKKGNTEEALSIANDIKENEQKINHHGKRADAIVKGMLQHSRTTSAIKEPTDINKLADEYLRLSYHGLRAKDKSFNATLKTDFDETIGKISIIPQDIGRVILNLITNAFYAVAEKKKHTPNNYEPTVTVRTSQTDPPACGGRGISITVSDNGNGIPKNIVDKIFQPFFTTKPTGQGTGLGLSLAYDIVKAHCGELKVDTKENEGLSAEALAQAGTTFIITLPLS